MSEREEYRCFKKANLVLILVIMEFALWEEAGTLLIVSAMVS